MHQKTSIDKSSRELIFFLVFFLFSACFFFFFAQPVDWVFLKGFKKTWFFFITWYNYYDFFTTQVVTDLNLLREIYFYHNSFEFFLINFLLFYGILSSILLTFFIKRIFSFINYFSFINSKGTSHPSAVYFIRNQDFLKQQAVSAGTRVWLKKKKFNNSVNNY